MNYFDRSGHFALTITALVWICFGISFAIGAASSIIGQGISSNWKDINALQVLWDASIAGVGGALSMSSLGFATMVLANAVMGFIGATGNHLIRGDEFDTNTWIDIGILTLIGIGIGIIGGTGAQHGIDFSILENNLNSASKNFAEISEKAASGYYKTVGLKTIYMNKASAQLNSALVMYGMRIIKCYHR